jgi:hypothetical protein
VRPEDDYSTLLWVLIAVVVLVDVMLAASNGGLLDGIHIP